MELQEKDLIAGKIYKYNYGHKYAIGICKESKLGRTNEIVYTDGSYFHNNYPSVNKWETATNIEKQWLKECIKAGKFIPLSEVEENQLNLIEIW